MSQTFLSTDLAFDPIYFLSVFPFSDISDKYRKKRNEVSNPRDDGLELIKYEHCIF